MSEEKKLGWTCHEVSGIPIVLCPDDDMLEKLATVPGLLTEYAYNKENQLRDPGGLEAGTEVLVPTLMGSWAHAGVAFDRGKPYAQSLSALYFLEFDEERECWVCHGAGNISAVRKLTIDP